MCFKGLKIKNKGLIRYRKLTIVLVSIGKREGDDIIPNMGYVGLQAIGRRGPIALYEGTRGSGDFHGHFTEVFGEDHN